MVARLCALLALLQVAGAIQMSLTVVIDSGKKDCFYQTIQQNIKVDLDFQVVHGGDVDIDLEIMSPQNQVMVREFKKSDGNHIFNTNVQGDYQFCFDNGYVSYGNKVIFFDIITDEPEPPKEWGGVAQQQDEQRKIIEAMNMTVSDVEGRLERIRHQLDRSEQYQRMFAAIELRDRSFAEDNFSRVNFWSVVFVCVMVCVAVLQVISIRSFFSDTNSIGAKKGMKMST